MVGFTKMEGGAFVSGLTVVPVLVLRHDGNVPSFFADHHEHRPPHISEQIYC
jgi:hypothetical protein